jgi:hypothetical protein
MGRFTTSIINDEFYYRKKQHAAASVPRCVCWAHPTSLHISLAYKPILLTPVLAHGKYAPVGVSVLEGPCPSLHAALFPRIVGEDVLSSYATDSGLTVNGLLSFTGYAIAAGNLPNFLS